jgi:hypothetical protein
MKAKQTPNPKIHDKYFVRALKAYKVEQQSRMSAYVSMKGKHYVADYQLKVRVDVHTALSVQSIQSSSIFREHNPCYRTPPNYQ